MCLLIYCVSLSSLKENRMKSLIDNKIILIFRETRLQELIARFNTLEQAKFYIEHLGADFSDYEIENKNYKEALLSVEKQLRNFGIVQMLKREFLPNFIFGKNDIIVVLGQDGLVANTLKYVGNQLVIAINPDPKRWDGVILPFKVNDVPKIMLDVLKGIRKYRLITMAKIQLNNGQNLYGVNDIFIGPKSHTSIRYEINIGNSKENQSSSGIIVSTGLGSTGWLKSILAGAKGIGNTIGNPLNIEILKNNFTWDSNYLFYTVREPFPSMVTNAELVFGTIKNNEKMKLVSHMPENGVIFSDGIEADFLEFNSGTEAIISVADKKGYLVI